MIYIDIISTTHMTTELVVGHIKLAKHVTRRKSHERKVGRVPCSHNDASILWIVFDFI